MAETQSLRTRGDIADSVGRFCQDSSLSRRAIIVDAIDLAYVAALESHRWPQLIRWMDAAVTVGANGSGFIHLPKYVRTIIGFSDTTNNFNLQEWSARPVVEFTQGFASYFGGAVNITHAGTVGIPTILTAGTLLQVFSSGTDARTVWLRGRRGNDQQQSSVILTGATPVIFQVDGATAGWDDVDQFEVVKGAAAENDNFLTLETTAGTDIAFIEANDLNAEYKRYRIDPIPSSATTFRIVYVQTPSTMFDDGQGYPIPIVTYLWEKAAARYYESRDMESAASRHRSSAELSLLRARMESGAMRLYQATPPSRGRGPWWRNPSGTW